MFTAGEALEAINSPNVDLIAIGRGILLDYNFISKIKSGNEDEIISEFDPNRTDKHHLQMMFISSIRIKFRYYFIFITTFNFTDKVIVE